MLALHQPESLAVEEALAVGENSLRIGIAYPGYPNAPGTWSGIPASLGNAIRELGCTVEPLRAQPPRAVEWLTTQALTALRLHRTSIKPFRKRVSVSRTISLYTSREMSALRTRSLRARVHRAQPLDAVVQLGTGYGLPAGLRIATFEDMTVKQALSLPYPEFQNLSGDEQTAAVKRQASAYSQALACCFTTQWPADSAVEEYGVPRSKVHVVGVGRNHSPRPIARDWSVPRFLFVGFGWERKNGDGVVRAFVRVRESVPEARLDLVGGHPQVDVEGITGHGPLSLGDDDERRKLDELFETATCFVMPSWYEPSAISYVEAAAAGIPSIGSSVGGSGDLIGDGGFVVDPGDEQALLDAMLTLSNPEAAREAGARALGKADRFTWHQVARRILAALELLPSTRGPT
jgi:glycosyltransferase involved in cell wall biosynthesis